MSTTWKPFISIYDSGFKKVLIVASLLATIPVLIMGTAAYFTASGKIIEEIGEANRQTLQQIQQRIDEKLITLENMTLQNAVNPTLSRFLSASDPQQDTENFGMTLTILNAMQVIIEDVDAVYLYRPDKRLVVSPNSGMVDDTVLPDYVRQAVSANPTKVWLDHKLESELIRDDFHQITLVRRINTSNETPPGYLIVNLNDTAFFRVFSDMQLGARELLIVTPSGNVFSDRMSSLLSDEESDAFLRKVADSDAEKQLRIENAEGDSLAVNALKSNYNGWNYVTVISYSELTRHLQKIKQTTFMLCLLLILTSIVATGVLSKRWYRAIHSLVDLIRHRGGVAEGRTHKNEFVYIRSYFESLHQNNQQLEKQIEESMPLLRANFIQKLLTEPYHSDMRERAAYYNLPVDRPKFTVMCIDLDNMRGQTERDVNLFQYAVINITKEIIGEQAEGLVIRMHNGHIAALINHGDDERSTLDAKLAANLFQIAEDIRKVAESLLHITVTIGIGRSYEGLDRIRVSCLEALEALEYQLIEGSGCVLFIEQLKPDAASFSYPYEIEQQIVTNLKLANMANIEALLDDFAQAIRTETLHHEHVRQSFAQLIAVSLRTLFELNPSGAQLHDYNLYYRLNELNTSAKIVNWLKSEVYPPIVDHLSSRMVQRTHSTIQKVLQHIHQHYDTDLSQPQLAALVSMPVSQFSHLFKGETGMTFSDYMIAFRMEKARHLLETTDAKIVDIAEMLRYNNSQNFIRVFKKMHGLTPGEYRLRSTKGQLTVVQQ